MADLENVLPHVNALLNGLALLLLLVGYVQIKQGKEQAHKLTMLACFGVSVLFLACYLYYHIVVLQGESKKFPTDAGPVRYAYYFILLTHVVLAALVPFLAIATIWTGLKAEHDATRRPGHRRLAWVTFPIWVYVSVTGVAVYVMLYHIYRPQPAADKIEASQNVGMVPQTQVAWSRAAREVDHVSFR